MPPPAGAESLRASWVVPRTAANVRERPRTSANVRSHSLAFAKVRGCWLATIREHPGAPANICETSADVRGSFKHPAKICSPERQLQPSSRPSPVAAQLPPSCRAVIARQSINCLPAVPQLSPICPERPLNFRPTTAQLHTGYRPAAAKVSPRSRPGTAQAPPSYPPASL